MRSRNHALIPLLSLLTVACATAPSERETPPAFLEAAVRGAATPAREVEAATTTPRLADFIGKPYTIVKAGTFLPSGDLTDLDDGVAGELIFGRSVLSFLAIEGSLGYLNADGQFGATPFELWAVPAFVNVRASLPVLFFEPYVGAGVGGMFADYSAGSLYSNSDFVAAYDAFVGLEFGIGNLAVGAEYKYVRSDDTENDFSIEGNTATLFVSIPF